MAYEVHIASFEGPLDLLLQLVEAEKLEITEISLVQVTDPFLAHLRAAESKLGPQELADFLLVAAKLVYLKSKALLPTVLDPELEEGPDLATQLKMYQAFVQAAAQLGMLAKAATSSWGRARPTVFPLEKAFRPPEGLTIEMILQSYRALVRRIEPLARLPRAAVDRVVSLEEKMLQLTERLREARKVSFHSFLAEADSRLEIAVSFLALLELIKQRTLRVEQADLFSEIHLHASE
jgi:segregation and condensation protein A